MMNLVKWFFLSFALLVTRNANYVQASDGKSIIGGDPAKTEQFFHQVAILNRDNRFKCVGSILDDYHVLTAASCLEEYPQFIVAGSINLNETVSENPKRIEIDIDRAFIHHGHYILQKNKYFPLYDVAVVVLKESLDLENNPHLAKVTLASKESGSFEGETAIVSGFGYSDTKTKISYNGEPIDHSRDIFGLLRWANTKTLSIAECQSLYYNKLDPKYHLCALTDQRSESGEGLCTGDKGGALIYNGMQIGIVNKSPYGCQKVVKYPVIYARVSPFYDFIMDAMNDEPRPPYTSIVY